MRGTGENGAAWPCSRSSRCPRLTETASWCPVKMCRRLHVAASQIMISLFLSPVAWQNTGGTQDLPLGDPQPTPTSAPTLCALGGPRDPFLTLVGVGAALTQQGTSGHETLLPRTQGDARPTTTSPSHVAVPATSPIPGTCCLTKWPCRERGTHAPGAVPQCPSCPRAPRTASSRSPPPLWKRHCCHPLGASHHSGKHQKPPTEPKTMNTHIPGGAGDQATSTGTRSPAAAGSPQGSGWGNSQSQPQGNTCI